MPAPATLKSVGYDCLTSLGYPLNRDRTGAVILSKVQSLLSERKVLFLHLDEVQHLYNERTNRESQAVVNTLKSLMQRADWPTGLILSGTRELQSLVNMDPQLSRRLTPVEFPSIDATTHAKEIKGIVSHYADIAGLQVNAGELNNGAFARRLIPAAARALGLVIALLVAAIEDDLAAHMLEIRSWLTTGGALMLESFLMVLVLPKLGSEVSHERACTSCRAL